MYKGECEEQIDSVDELRDRSFRIVVKSAKCLVLLVGEDFLTTLAAGHTILLLLASFGRRELLSLLRTLDFVALSRRLVIVPIVCEKAAYHSIKFLLFIVVLIC